jgi:TetR/AcrR family transcriptional repressor of nem operon
VNTALETAPHDPDVAAVVAEGLRGMETFFAAQIARGQASGEIGPDVAPEDDARALLALLVGMRVFSRARPEATLLDAVAAQAARIVDG